jgi:hypothetical protein
MLVEVVKDLKNIIRIWYHKSEFLPHKAKRKDISDSFYLNWRIMSVKFVLYYEEN